MYRSFTIYLQFIYNAYFFAYRSVFRHLGFLKLYVRICAVVPLRIWLLMAFIRVLAWAFGQLNLLGCFAATWDLRCHIYIMLAWSFLAQDGALRKVLRSRYDVLAELVMQWHELIHFVEADFTIEHTERVVSIGLSCCSQLFVINFIHITIRSFF